VLNLVFIFFLNNISPLGWMFTMLHYAGAADEISFTECFRNKAACPTKLCAKAIPDKAFCPK
jgi:hypothetical protein